VLTLEASRPVLDELGAADGFRAFAPAAEKGRRATSFLIVNRVQGAVVVSNNPINWSDPFGLDAIPGMGGGVGPGGPAGYGPWTLNITKAGNGDFDIVWATYKPDAADVECCDQITVFRFATHDVRRNVRDDYPWNKNALEPIPVDKTKKGFYPVNSSADQPGPRAVTAWLGIIYEIDFEFRATCTAGEAAGKVLSTFRTTTRTQGTNTEQIYK